MIKENGEGLDAVVNEYVDLVIAAGFQEHMSTEALVECIKNMVMEGLPVRTRNKFEVQAKTMVERRIWRVTK